MLVPIKCISNVPLAKARYTADSRVSWNKRRLYKGVNIERYGFAAATDATVYLSPSFDV